MMDFADEEFHGECAALRTPNSYVLPQFGIYDSGRRAWKTDEVWQSQERHRKCEC